MRQPFITEFDKSLLQNMTVLLQYATAVTKCVVTKLFCHYMIS